MTDTTEHEYPAAWWPRPAIRMSREVGALTEALAAAQSEMKHPVKSRENAHFRSKYADLADVIDATGTLNRHGIAVMGSTMSDIESESVRILIVFTHVSGQWQEGALDVPVPAMTAQGLGSACTYGRRYLLSLMCNVASDDDDDGNAASAPRARETPLVDNRPMSAGNVAAVRKEAAELGASDSDIAAWVVLATDGRTEKLPLVYTTEVKALRDAVAAWKKQRETTGRSTVGSAAKPPLENARP